MANSDATKITTFVGIEGEREYKKALEEMGREMRMLASEGKKLEAVYADNANSLEALRAKNEHLNRVQVLQKKELDKLREAHENAITTIDDGGKAAAGWAIKISNMETAIIKTDKALEENAAALENAQKYQDAFGMSADELKAKSGALGDTVVNMADKIGIVLPENAKKATDALNLVDTSTIALVGTSVKLVKGLIDCSVAAAQNADNLITLSSQTGLTTERLQELQYASELVDVSIDQIADATRQMINSMREASKGTGDAAEAYKKLGVRVTDAQGNLRDSQEVFDEVVMRLSRVRNATERNALAMKIFGESATKLNPIIEDGGKKLKALSEEAHNMGYVMSDETLASLGALDDAMQRFDKTSEAVKNQMALALLPVLTSVLDIITAIPPGVLSTVAVAVTLITTIAAAAKALKTITSITSLFGISATKTLGTILAVVAALIALSAIIAVIAGKGNDLNRAMSSVGNAVGSVQGNVQKAQKTIPRYASGTDFHPGGWALVGENGPEAVMLPRGTRVYTAQETARMGGGDVYNISINADNVKQFVDIVRIAQSERRSMRMG